MVIALGVFNLFTYAIPGSMYVAAIVYVANRADWVDAASLMESPSALLLAALTVAGYIVGQATYRLSWVVDRFSPFHSATLAHDATVEFIQRNPTAAACSFLHLDTFLLLAAVEVNEREAAADVSRIRAVGLMLRNCFLPIVLGAAIALVEVFASARRMFAGVSCIILLLVAVGCL